LPHIKAGNLRVLGCFSEERSATYPDAPTLREQGQDVVAEAWFGFLAPAATPDPIIDKMQAEVGHALSDGDVRQKLSLQGLDVHYLPGPEFGKFVQGETDKWGKIIREAGLDKQ
jgi:tripartite-type tricarboxylate transporter receptor subunit TctC